jgi:hypothetical protein
MKSRYSLMSASEQANTLGQLYPDIMTYPINKFLYTEDPYKVILTTAYIQRFYLVSYAYYDTSDYTDFLLFFNNYSSFHELEEGDEILVPTKNDVNSFFLKYIQG